MVIFCRSVSPILLTIFGFFQCLVGCDGIPCRAGILQHRLHKCLVCCIFQPLAGGLDVAPEEAQVLLALLQTSVILFI